MARAEHGSCDSIAGYRAARAPSHPDFYRVDLHPRGFHESCLSTISFAAGIFKY